MRDEFMTIKLSEIKLRDEFMHRESYEVKDFSAELKQDGQLVPLLVRPHEAGGYELLSGYRRYHALKGAKITEVHVRVLDLETDKEAVKVVIVENYERKDLNPIEEATILRTAVEKCGWKPEELAAFMHQSKNWIYARLQLLKTDPAVQKAIEKGIVPIDGALALSKLPVEQQQELIAKYKEETEWGDGAPRIDDIKAEVDQRIERADEVAKFKKLLEKAKIKNCPVRNCNKKPKALGRNDGMVRCETGNYGGHEWDPVTGKTPKGQQTIVEKHKPVPRPVYPVEFRAPITPYDVWDVIKDATQKVKEAEVRSVEVTKDWQGGWKLEVGFTSKKPMPDLEVERAKFKTGETALVRAGQRYNNEADPVRKKRHAVVQAWLKKEISGAEWRPEGLVGTDDIDATCSACEETLKVPVLAKLTCPKCKKGVVVGEPGKKEATEDEE